MQLSKSHPSRQRFSWAGCGLHQGRRAEPQRRIIFGQQSAQGQANSDDVAFRID